MHHRLFAPLALTAAALIVALGILAGFRGIAAQGTSATPPGEPVASYPAHIHDGACPEVGDVVHPLNNLMPAGPAATAAAAESLALAATPESTPFVIGDVVATSTTDVDASLDDILSAERAVNVHESDLNIQRYIACGDLTGTPTNGELEIELQQLDNSGYTGTARLVDNGDGTTTVTVELRLSPIGGTPEASPVG